MPTSPEFEESVEQMCRRKAGDDPPKNWGVAKLLSQNVTLLLFLRRILQIQICLQKDSLCCCLHFPRRVPPPALAQARGPNTGLLLLRRRILHSENAGSVRWSGAIPILPYLGLKISVNFVSRCWRGPILGL